MQLRILTLNTWLLRVPVIGAKETSLRSRVLPRALVRAGADIIFLQEVWHPVDQRRISVELAAQGYPHSCAMGGTLADGLMVVSRFPLDGSPSFFRHPGRATGWERFLRKGTLRVDVKVPALGTVRLVNVHMHDAVEPAQQLDELRQAMAWAHTDRMQPTIMAGDFNFHYADNGTGNRAPAYRHLEGELGFSDCYRSVHGAGGAAESTWDRRNPYVSMESKDRVLDYVFVSRHFRPQSASVQFREGLSGLLEGVPKRPAALSDHFGVMTDLQVH